MGPTYLLLLIVSLNSILELLSGKSMLLLYLLMVGCMIGLVDRNHCD
jgi:hypothetical protein